MDKDLEKEVKLQEEIFKRGEISENKATISKLKSSENAKKREFKFRRLRQITVGIAILTSLTSGLIAGYKLGHSKGEKEGYKTATEYSYVENYTLDTAPDDILVEWAYAVKNQNINDDDIRQNCQNVIDSYIRYSKLKNNTFENEVLKSNELESNYDKEYNEYKYQVNKLEENLSTSYNYPQYSFENSLYSKSILEDNVIYIPYSGSRDNISDNVKIININGVNKLFIPSSYNYKNYILEELNKENGYTK